MVVKLSYDRDHKTKLNSLCSWNTSLVVHCFGVAAGGAAMASAKDVGESFLGCPVV